MRIPGRTCSPWPWTKMTMGATRSFVSLPSGLKMRPGGGLCLSIVIGAKMSGSGIRRTRTHAMGLRDRGGRSFPRIPPRAGIQKALEIYAQQIPALLMRLDPTGRLTPARLQSFLYEEIMSWTGRDASAATIITGTTETQHACRCSTLSAGKAPAENPRRNSESFRNRINLAAMPRVSADQRACRLRC